MYRGFCPLAWGRSAAETHSSPAGLPRAYLVFAQLGSADAQTAIGQLIKACGSVDAANAYLAQLQAEMEAGEE